MMLFKFDIKYVRLNFKTIASMKFSFDLYLILTWSRNYVSFKWNVKKTVTKKIWKNSVSRVSIDWESPSIDYSRYGYVYLMRRKSEPLKSSKSLGLKLRINWVNA